jgi:hypothetical protein
LKKYEQFYDKAQLQDKVHFPKSNIFRS